MLTRLLAFLVALTPASPVLADPCGMVPPIWVGPGSPITRIGVQKTYVFYKNGIESLVLRPGFSGKVEEFGMLIPFPSPPAIRKVADDVFSHLAAAADPPEVVVDLRVHAYRACEGPSMGRPSGKMLMIADAAAEDQVVVVRQEAVGMYEVAVLDAGSAKALKVWMDDHGFRYPEGMDSVCEEYVEEGWCFVAVKTRVGHKSGADPRPGMRDVDTSLAAGETFDGHVQAMGFRFATDELVVPMRLSAFNEGELHNVVYVLSDGPRRIANLPEEMVVRQIPGHRLYRNVVDPLPLRVVGGSLAQIPDWQLQGLPAQRDPLPHNGIARELFAADLLAARTGSLSHAHEEREKELLDIGERLGLRGPEIDALIQEALLEDRERVVADALTDLQGMTFSIVDGDFPRDVIAAENLRFASYTMPQQRNRAAIYDARFEGPNPLGNGSVIPVGPRPPHFLLGLVAIAGLLLLAARANRERGGERRAVPLGAAFLLLFAFVAPPAAQASAAGRDRCAPPRVRGVHELLQDARENTSLVQRGRSIVALTEIGGRTAVDGLRDLQDSADSRLVQTWASAALVELATSPRELHALSARSAVHPALVRPVAKRWLALLGDRDFTVRLEIVLDALATSPVLQQKLLPVLLEREPREFLTAMLTAEGQNARNLAAACLATLGAQGRESIPAVVLTGLRFDPDAMHVPWTAGALFVPALPWTKEDARRLMRELVAWHLYCERNELGAEQRQIHNNLNSWGLANAAGYAMPGREQSTTRLLLLFGETAGAEALRELLAEQGLSEDPRYAAVLTLVSAG